MILTAMNWQSASTCYTIWARPSDVRSGKTEKLKRPRVSKKYREDTFRCNGHEMEDEIRRRW